MTLTVRRPRVMNGRLSCLLFLLTDKGTLSWGVVHNIVAGSRQQTSGISSLTAGTLRLAYG